MKYILNLHNVYVNFLSIEKKITHQNGTFALKMKLYKQIIIIQSTANLRVQLLELEKCIMTYIQYYSIIQSIFTALKNALGSVYPSFLPAPCQNHFWKPLIFSLCS